mmetsp:Transcript_19075/g.34662  ORF Transcript_19075/g.34662 Transcript_19075/m.34662 type:complete len:149 (+) Transcript_19075:2680-3126(+)
MDPIQKLSKLLDSTQTRLKAAENRVAILENELALAEKKSRDVVERCRQSELETKRYAKNLASLEQAYTALSKELVDTKRLLQNTEAKAKNEGETLKSKLQIQSQEMETQGEAFQAALTKEQLKQGSVYSYRQNVKNPDLKQRYALTKG